MENISCFLVALYFKSSEFSLLQHIILSLQRIKEHLKLEYTKQDVNQIYSCLISIYIMFTINVFIKAFRWCHKHSKFIVFICYWEIFLTASFIDVYFVIKKIEKMITHYNIKFST